MDEAVEIGCSQLKELERSWPHGFHDPIKKKVVTMVTSKKHVKVGDTRVYEMVHIYSRVLCLNQSRDISIKEVLYHELAPVPAALFDEEGQMRSASGKSDLKRCLWLNTRKDSNTRQREFLLMVVL